MFHDGAAEHEIQRIAFERQRMDVADDVQQRIEDQIHPDDAGIVEALTARAKVKGNLGIGQRAEDDALFPAGIVGACRQDALVLDPRPLGIVEHNRNAVDDWVPALAAAAHQAALIESQDAGIRALGTGKEFQEAHG